MHAVSGFLLENGGNIEEAAQFNDQATGLFFMRVQFVVTDENPEAKSQAMRAALDALAAQFDMRWQLHDAAQSQRPKATKTEPKSRASGPLRRVDH